MHLKNIQHSLFNSSFAAVMKPCWYDLPQSFHFNISALKRIEGTTAIMNELYIRSTRDD